MHILLHIWSQQKFLNHLLHTGCLNSRLFVCVHNLKFSGYLNITAVVGNNSPLTTFFLPDFIEKILV